MSRFRSPVLESLLAAALFGASTPASKVLLGTVPPVTLAGLLYVGAALAALPWAWRDRSAVGRLDLRNLLLLGGAVTAGGGIAPVLLLAGLLRAPAAPVSLWLNLETVATILLGWAIFREHLAARTWLACLVMLAASVTLAAPQSLELGSAGALVALACIFWGLDNHLTALIDRFTPAQTTFAKGLIAGVVNLGIGFWLESSAIGAAALAGALSVGMLAYGLSLALYIGAAQQLGAVRSQLIFSTAPFWGMAMAWSWLGEPVTLAQGIAAGLFAAGVWLLRSERHAHPHRHDALTHTHPHRHDEGMHAHPHAAPPRSGWHSHEHEHDAVEHTHPHMPDLHHRHPH